jgi:hypothetical protein
VLLKYPVAVGLNADRAPQLKASVGLLSVSEGRGTEVMRLAILAFVAIVLFGPVPQRASGSRVERILVFEGTVLRIGQTVPASGFMAFYRLAKYRVEKACLGKYTKSEIVVDHLSLTTRELDGIKVGDRVWVTVEPSKKIFSRYNEEGIREKSENVRIFYIGGEVVPGLSGCDSLPK